METAWTSPYTVASSNGESKILGACEYDGYLFFATQNYLYKIQNENLVQADWTNYVVVVGNLSADPVVGDNLYMGGYTEEYALQQAYQKQQQTRYLTYQLTHTYQG